MQLEKKIVRDGFEKVESELEKLSIQMIAVLKEYKEKGIIEEREYKKHIKCKEEFLIYLSNKRSKVIIE